MQTTARVHTAYVPYHHIHKQVAGGERAMFDVYLAHAMIGDIPANSSIDMKLGGREIERPYIPRSHLCNIAVVIDIMVSLRED